MTAIKKFAIAVAFIAMASSAAAQNPNVPVGLNLNGIWELDEHGERLDKKNNPLVLIEHTGMTVTAKFLTGAECFDTTKRTVVFDGVITFAVPGEPTLSSNNMPVCSGSSSAVKKCGGSIPSMYRSNFTGVTLTPDLNTGGPNLITGQRYAQGYRDCGPDSSSDGTHPFTLTRASRCALEERKVTDWETVVLEHVKNIVGNARVVFRSAAELAEARYPETFTSPYVTGPSHWVSYPYVTVGGDWDADAEMAEDYLSRMPEVLASDEWNRARQMAEAMGFQDMVTEMGRVAAEIPYGQRYVTSLRNARADLAACRARKP